MDGTLNASSMPVTAAERSHTVLGIPRSRHHAYSKSTHAVTLTPSYPDDYPPLETEMTVTGAFGTYEENGFTYLQLNDADVEWAQ